MMEKVSLDAGEGGKLIQSYNASPRSKSVFYLSFLFVSNNLEKRDLATIVIAYASPGISRFVGSIEAHRFVH